MPVFNCKKCNQVMSDKFMPFSPFCNECNNKIAEQEDTDQLIRHYAGLAMQAHVSKNGTILFDEEDAKRCIKVATVLANTLKG